MSNQYILTISFAGTSPAAPGTQSNVPQDSTSGAGTGATFDITWGAGPAPYSTVVVNNPGSGYVSTDTITILGTSITGGASPANDLTITIVTSEGDDTGSGGAAVAGIGLESVEYAEDGHGGALVDGIALLEITQIEEGSGGAVVAGHALEAFELPSYEASGGATLGGTALVPRTRAYEGSDGILIGGTPLLQLTQIQIAIPGLSPRIGGEALTELVTTDLTPIPPEVKSKVPVATVLAKMIPEFIREDDPLFVAFCEAYYSFMEDETLDLPAMTTIRNLELFRDIDKTLDDFIIHLRDEYLPQLPTTTSSEVRFFLKNMVSIFQAKGSVKSFKALFLLVFGKNAEVFFPWKNVLKVSDGKWMLNFIIKVTANTGDPLELKGQLITQGTASGYVEEVQYIEEQSAYLITINISTLKGIFVDNETLSGLSNVDGSTIICNVQTIVTNICVAKPGSYHNVGEHIQFDDLNTGYGVRAFVSAIKTGGVDEVLINNPGDGYRAGEILTIDNLNSGGTGFAAEISEVELDSLVMEDVTTGCNKGYILNEDGNHIPLEEAVTGPVKAVRVVNRGTGYKIPPIIEEPASDGWFIQEDDSGYILTETSDRIVPEWASTGEDGVLLAAGHDIGRISKISFIDHGIGFTSAPLAYAEVRALIKDLVGDFNVQEPVTVDPTYIMMEDGYPCYVTLETGDKILTEVQSTTGVAGEWHSLDVDRQLLAINNLDLPVGRNFEVDTTIRGSETDSTARIIDLNNAELNLAHIIMEDLSGYVITEDEFKIRLEDSTCGVEIGGMAALPGFYGNDDGKLDDASKVIQDSYYWQVYSYVIRSQ